MNLKSLLRSFLGIPLTIIAFLFIGKVFLDGWDDIISNISSIKPELFILGIVFYALFFLVKASAWIGILNARGHNFEKRQTIFDYSYSEIKRYIPGSIFAFIGRVATHKTIPKKETLKGIGIEAVLLIASALVVSVPALYYIIKNFLPHLQNFFEIIFPLTFAALLVLLMIIPKARAFLLRYGQIFVSFMLAWSLYGIGSLLILLSIESINPANFIQASSIFVFAWACGYLFFITPMGLGARELVVVFGLSLLTTPALASAIAVISRLSMILGEVTFLAMSYEVKKLKKSSLFFRIDKNLLVVIFAAVLYFYFFSYYSMLKHDAFLTGRFDLGNMAQTVWNTYHGNFFTLTNPDGVKNISRLGVHSDIFLVFLTPLYLIWENPKILLVFQSLALALSGIFVYSISKIITKKSLLSVVFALSFFSNFWIHEQNLFDFHAVSIATLFILIAFYFFLKKKFWSFALFIALSATTKENVLLIIPFFSIYFLKTKRWIVATLLIVIPLALFYLLVAVFIPQARGEAHFALGGYEYLGNSPTEMLINFIRNPSIIASQIFNFSTVAYLKHHFISTGYLSIISPFYLLFTLPDMAIYLLTSNLGYRSYQYHFGAVIVPFFYISAMYGALSILKKVNFIKENHIAIYLVLVTLYSLYYYSPLPGMKNGDTAPLNSRGGSEISRYLTAIPPPASVSSSNSIGAHLSHRENIYVVPHGMAEATYIVLYKEESEVLQRVDTMEYDILIKDENLNFYIFRKKLNTSCATCRP